MRGELANSATDPFENSGDFLESYRRGDRGALENVYRFFERPLRNFVTRGFSFRSGGRRLYFSGATRSPDVDDVVQETFRRAFGPKARQSYDGLRPFRNYLFTIARNVILTDGAVRHRQISIGGAIELERAETERASGRSRVARSRGGSWIGPTTEEELEDRELLGLVRTFLDRLTPLEQHVFCARFLGLLSQETTAREHGCDRSRVRRLESGLRRRLLEHLRGTGYLEPRVRTGHAPRSDVRALSRLPEAAAASSRRRVRVAGEFCGVTPRHVDSVYEAA